MAARQPIGSLRSVVICPRGREGLDAAIADVKASTGTDIVTVTASVSNAEDLKGVVVRASAEFGPITVLVNNASTHAASAFRSRSR